MRSEFYIIVILLLAVQSFRPLFAQSLGESALNDWAGNPRQEIVEIKLPPPTLEGSYYISDKWHSGTIEFKDNKLLTNYSLKYDLENNLLEIMSDVGLVVCGLPFLNSFQWYNYEGNDTTRFTNCENFIFEGENEIIGVVKIAARGKINLYSRNYIVIQEPTYNQALNVGNRNKKILIKTTYYLGKNKNLVAIQSKKKFLKYFGNEAKKIEKYRSTNKLKIKEEDDLKQIIDYYNSNF